VALTPVAALMFRFDNPDALLVLLLTVATYAVVRAIEAGKTKWLVLAATLVGFAFLTKMLQAFLVVAGIRARLPPGGARVLATAHRSTRDRGRDDGGRIRVVGRDRPAHACGGPAVHRRLAGQQPPQPDLWL
jgi:predicted membrane-bound mannosyltransferase